MSRQIKVNGAMVYTNDVTIYEVWTIEINEEEKIIELWDLHNYTIARIDYEESSGPVEFINYNKDGNIKESADTIVNSNGKVVY